MNTITKSVRWLLVLLALLAPTSVLADACRFSQTGSIILSPAQLNPNVEPLKAAVKKRGGQVRSVDLKILVPLIYERNIGCARLPNGNPRPGWETSAVLTQAIANLNAGGGTNLEWISFAERIQTSGFRLPGFAPAQAAATPRRTTAAPRPSTPRRTHTPAPARAAPQPCGLCTAGGLN